jgi:ribosomal protein L11 methyltransferase
MSGEAPRYPFVHLDVPEEEAEELSMLLFELGAEGVEVRDGTTLSKGEAGNKVTLVGAFASHEAANEALAEIDRSYAPRLEEIVGDAWRDAWKEHYRPFALTPHVTVRPPWEPYEATRPDEHVLELEPGRAFGTGLHATTSLVAKVLERERHRLAGATVLDLGTGSGILSLVALTLGAKLAVATDIDPDAVEVARENADRNGLGARLVVSTTPVEEVDGSFPVVMANIEARVLIPLAGAIAGRVARGGLLVLSGILAGQEDDVVAAYPAFRTVTTDLEGEWVCLALST